MYVSSTSLNYWGGGYQQNYRPVQRKQTTQVSIWADAPLFGNHRPHHSYDFIGGNNGVENVTYSAPGDSYVPMDHVMTGPFGANVDILGSNRSNPFESSITTTTTSIFDDGFNFSSRRRSAHHDHDNFLSLTRSHEAHKTNTFRAHNDSDDDIHIKNSRTVGRFGTNVRRNSTSIVNESNGTRINQTNTFGRSSLHVSGDIESVSRTRSHEVGPNKDLTRTVTRVEDEDNIYKIKRTQGTIWR